MADQHRDLDSALDQLFAAELGEFTRLRNALARAARDAGDAGAARAIASLHRPAIAAWAVNQLPRRAPEDFSRLLEAGRRMRAAQRAALEGKRASAQDLREATQEQRQLVASLTERAGAILAGAGHPPSPANLEAVRLALSAAASLTGEERDRLARGRLERPVVSSGFGGLEDEEPRARRAAAAHAERTSPPRPRDREFLERLASARAAKDEAARRSQELAVSAGRLEERAAALRSEAQRAEQAAHSARAESSAAARKLEVAEAELARAVDESRSRAPN